MKNTNSLVQVLNSSRWIHFLQWWLLHHKKTGHCNNKKNKTQNDAPILWPNYLFFRLWVNHSDDWALTFAYLCLCLPPDRTWYKVNDSKVDYSGIKGGKGRTRVEARAQLGYARHRPTKCNVGLMNLAFTFVIGKLAEEKENSTFKSLYHCIGWLIDWFYYLGLFYALKWGNCIHYTFISSFPCCFLIFFFQLYDITYSYLV